jgi:uncharacterized protein (TIGR04255 family)
VRRNLPALHLRHAPLIYVVAQVRFSAIVAIEKYVPEIQEKLRHKGFPRFLKAQVQEVALQIDAAPKLSTSDRFEFQDKDASLGIVLQSNSVAVHTNRYSDYEAFEEHVKTALMAVNRVVGIGLSERIGLRYVNLVRLKPNEGWREYLHEGLLGLDSASVGVESWTSSSQFVGKTEVGQLAVRCSRSAQPFPPDLLTSTLAYSLELAKDEIVTTLDFDHYIEQVTDFKVAKAISMLEQLHESLDRVFMSAVTSDALTRWGRVKTDAKHN